MEKQKTRPKEGGFSLIEMLVVLLIIALIVIGGIMSRGETRARKAAEVEALEIKAMLEQAKDYALTGEAVEDEGELIVPGFFIFELEEEGGNYRIYAADSSGDQIGEDLEAESVDPDSKVTINITGGDKLSISFAPPHADTDLDEDAVVEVCGDEDCSKDSLKYEVLVTKESDDQGNSIRVE